jgi:hypothetical protein
MARIGAKFGLPGWWMNRRSLPQSSLVKTYEAITSASVDQLWQVVTNLADMSWHPILASTNVPNGLVIRPGLMYQAVTRRIPIPIQIFVERVRPNELLSVRILVMPGLEEQVSYHIESRVCGACVSYSVSLRGWLSPLFWSLIRPCAAQVAFKLVQSAEQAMAGKLSMNDSANPRGYGPLRTRAVWFLD